MKDMYSSFKLNVVLCVSIQNMHLLQTHTPLPCVSYLFASCQVGGNSISLLKIVFFCESFCYSLNFLTVVGLRFNYITCMIFLGGCCSYFAPVTSHSPLTESLTNFSFTSSFDLTLVQKTCSICPIVIIRFLHLTQFAHFITFDPIGFSRSKWEQEILLSLKKIETYMRSSREQEKTYFFSQFFHSKHPSSHSLISLPLPLLCKNTHSSCFPKK